MIRIQWKQERFHEAWHLAGNIERRDWTRLCGILTPIQLVAYVPERRGDVPVLLIEQIEGLNGTTMQENQPELTRKKKISSIF